MRKCKKTFQGLPRAGDSRFRGHMKGKCRWTGGRQMRELGDEGQHGSSWVSKNQNSVPQMKTERPSLEGNKLVIVYRLEK